MYSYKIDKSTVSLSPYNLILLSSDLVKTRLIIIYNLLDYNRLYHEVGHENWHIIRE